MAIIFNDKTRVFTLQTRESAYQMKIGDHGVLLHLYFGKRIPDTDLSYLIVQMDRGFSGNPAEAELDRTFSLDTLPQEYSCFGTGDYRNSCLHVINADGSNAAALRYQSHKIYGGKYRLTGLPTLYAAQGDIADTLEITMKDASTGLRVVLYYGVLEDLGVITRAVRIINGQTGPVSIEKALSACLDFSGKEYDLINFYGRHAMERETERCAVRHGRHSIGSVRGASSHHYNPFYILCEKQANEDFGGCYGMSFLYSGNFIGEVEVDQISQTRMTIGIHPDGFSWRLEPGEEFTAPEAVLAYTGQGLGALSEIYHRAYRKNLCRGSYQFKRRPVLINNWEATYFDFNGKKLIEIAQAAKELGIEMLVMDDGWFGSRRDDFRGLGDWTVNEEKLGMSLAALVQRINETGMKFGIWFEPEMVSEDSDLYRSHPDWVMNIPGRPAVRSRNQLVLDFSRQEVRDFVYDAMCGVLDAANIEYVKWDMNRSLSDIYSAVLPHGRQGEVFHRYVLGLYDFLEKLCERYPKLLIEGCSGGGGRFDAGMLHYTPQIWCSDDTDAIERIRIQYGTSFGYPISAVGSHVSICPNHQTGRITPLETRGIVAMAGSFGYELDISILTEEEKSIVKRQVGEYKRFYHLIHEGRYFRLSDPYKNESHAAWEFAAADGSEALLCHTALRLYANPAPVVIGAKGLDENETYRINGEGCWLGSVLMNGGLVMPIPQCEYEAKMYHIEKIG